MEFEIETSKSKAEITQILQRNTSRHASIFWRKNDEFFSGEILQDSFKIQRNISYKNQFRPVIIGQIYNTEKGSKLKIKMRFSRLVALFLFFWFIALIFAFISMIVKIREFPLCFIPISFLLIAFFIVRIAWKIEERKAISKLHELLK